MPTELTSHAKDRLQQCAIPPIVLDLLHRFGTSTRCDGADRPFFDKSAIRRLKAHLDGDPGLRVVEAWLRVYLVVADNGRILTVAHPTPGSSGEDAWPARPNLACPARSGRAFRLPSRGTAVTMSTIPPSTITAPIALAAREPCSPLSA